MRKEEISRKEEREQEGVKDNESKREREDEARNDGLRVIESEIGQ